MKKTTILIVAIVLMTSLAACRNKDASSGAFQNIDDDDIPDVLKQTVGTLAGTYFSSGLTDTGYHAVLNLAFEDTTDSDYTTLMEHYQSTSTGTDEHDFLLFDWGKLHVMAQDHSISVIAFIQ